MSFITRLLKTEVSLVPFQIANRIVVPLAMMGLGCYRTWAIAETPFEEFVGIWLSITVALLWTMCFGYIMPQRSRTTPIS